MKKKIKKVYRVKDFSPIPQGKAQKVGEYLERIAKADGKISPRKLVKMARSGDSPIHEFLEWDDKMAGESFRIMQARKIISHFEVELSFNGETTVEKAFFNLEFNEEKSENQNGYVDLETVVTTKEYQDQVVENALKELIAWKDRYKRYQALNAIFEAIEKVQRKLDL